MPRDLNDPQYLRFMTENMNKEEEKRLLWFTKNQEKITEASKFRDNYKEVDKVDVEKTNLNLYLPSLSKNYQSSIRNRRTKPLRDGLVQGFADLPAPKLGQITTSVPLPVMFPVDESVQKLLAVRLPYGGRQQYLKVRNCLDPEEKYLFEETMNNAYGWRLGDSSLPYQVPKHGRYGTFFNNLYSRTGPQNDPSYYQPPASQNYSKCEQPHVACAECGPLRNHN